MSSQAESGKHSGGHILLENTSAAEKRALEDSAEKSSDLSGNLSPVVRFVFLAASGLSGSD